MVPSLTARADFFEVEEDSGKSQKQVRNRSETPKRQHLPSIQPSIIATATPTTTTSTTTTTTTTTRIITGSTSTSISGTSNDITLTITKIVPSLTARADFFEVEEDSGKGQKQVRNRSETPKRQHLPSIQPSIIATATATATATPTTTTSSSTTTTTTTTSTTSSTSTSISGTSNDITLTITKIVPSLTARADFFELEEDSGKGQKQVRNTKKAALA